MKRLFGIAAIAVVGVAQAQTPSIVSYCNMTPMEQRVASATAFIVGEGALTDKHNGFHSLDHAKITVDGGPVCPATPLYDEDRSLSGRTAFLVGDKLMVTAPHGPDFYPDRWAVIFGLHATISKSGACIPPDFDNIPNANIYWPPTGVPTIFSSYDASASPNIQDFALFTLERSVPGVAPLPIRRNGSPDLGDPLISVGYPAQTPAKASRGGSIGLTGPNAVSFGATTALVGSSGSPVINMRSNLVETVVAKSRVTGLWTLREKEGCYTLNEPEQSPYYPTAPYANATNGQINYQFAAHVPIPPNELQVAPLTTVVHAGPGGGPVSNAFSEFTVAAPPTATGPLSFRVALPMLLPPAPSLTLSPPAGNYTVLPGAAPLRFTVSAGAGAVTGCKLVETGIGIIPSDPNSLTSFVRQRFDIGMTNFTVSSTAAWNVQELGAPYPTRSFSVTNTTPNPTSVTVTPNVAWIRVNGSATATVNLTAAGTPGASANVTLSLDDAFSGFPLQSETKSGLVTVASGQPQCSLRQSESISVALTRGIERFFGVNMLYDWLPGPTGGATFGAPIDLPVDIDNEAAFTVDDVDFSIGFNDAGGVYMSPQQADTQVKVELIAPDGTTAVLWDRNNAPQSYFGFEPAGSGAPEAAVIKLDQSTTPPLGAGSLNVFAGKTGNGRWIARIRTTDATNHIQVSHVSLRITKKRNADFFAYNTQYDYLPGPAAGQTFGPAVDLPVDLSADAAFTVNDVNLAIGFYSEGSGIYMPTNQVDEKVRVELIAPDGTTAMLWDRGNAAAAYFGSQTISWLGGATVEVLKLDDQATPPTGPTALGVFNGRPGKGIWTVRLRTTDTTQRVLLSHVNLSIGR